MKKRKISISRKPYYAGAAALILLLLLLFVVFTRGAKDKRTAAETEGEEDTLRISISWSDTDYEGTYTGYTVSGVPEGSGVFTDADGELTYTGNWKKGKFDGYGKIEFSDGTWEEGVYLSGRHHWFRKYKSKSEYKDSLYDSGVLYGCRSEYKDGELVHETLTANGDHVSEIKRDALKLTRKLIMDKGYIGKYVFVTGVVDYYEESSWTCSYRIASEEVGMITGDYVNTSGFKSSQPMMANMKEGDKVTIYGYYTGTVRDELKDDTDYYGYQCLQIDPVYGEVQSDAERGTYASIRENPYSYCGRIIEGEFVVDRFSRVDTSTYVNVHVSGNADECYVLDVESDEDETFYPGSRLSLRGFIDGQRNVSSRTRTTVHDDQERKVTVYTKYPSIHVMSYEVE